MKTFQSLFLGLAALSYTAFAAPTLSSRTKDAAFSNNAVFAQSVVQSLLVDVKQHTAAIDAIAASVHPATARARDSAAQDSARRELVAITSAINAAKGQTAAVSAAGGYGKSTATEAGPVAALLKELLDTLNAATANLEDALGLGAVGDLLQPLDSAVDGLVIGLGGLVDGLLAAVGGLLGGLTGGIGGLLGGLLGGLGL